MKNRMSRDQLRHLAQNDKQPFLVNTMNAVVDALRASGIPINMAGGMQDGNGDYQFPAIRSRRPADWVQVTTCLDNVSPFGIVEVYASAYTNDTNEITLSVRKATKLTPGLLYAGNEDYDLYATYPGWVRVINPYAPVTVRSNGGVLFNNRVGILNAGDDFITSIGDGYLRAISAAQPVTGYTPVIRDEIIGPLVGKTTSAVSIGNLGTVEVWSLPSGAALTSSASLTDSGQTVTALFLFGGTTGAGKWVEITPHYFGLVATVITCPS